jgi:hypothetical protein
VGTKEKRGAQRTQLTHPCKSWCGIIILAQINIVEKVGGAPIGLLDHKRHNITSTVLSIKALHYGKVHENRESASEAEIPSKLNCEYLKNFAEPNEQNEPKKGNWLG